MLPRLIRGQRGVSSGLRFFKTSSTCSKMQRPPFKEVESRRDAFTSSDYKVTKAPDPTWTIGQGLNTKHNRSHDFKADREKDVIDPADLDAGDNYKMLVSGIIPRPIALLSTQDKQGTRNLAPFSYFAAAHHNPPSVTVSLNANQTGQKDSTRNIMETKKFTVNIISEPFVEAANWTSVDAPAEVDEWKLSGLTPVAADYWGKEGPPRVGESAFSIECELANHLDIKSDQGEVTGTLIVGRIRRYILNKGIRQEDGAIDPNAILPISRGGGLTYFRSNVGFELPRPKWNVEKESDQVKALI